MGKYFLLLAVIFIGAAGQIFFKMTVNQLIPQLPEIRSFGDLMQNVFIIMRNYKILSVLALYGVGFFLWFFSLTKFELSYAFPMMAIIYILIFLASWLIFKENISAIRIAGNVLIALGVVLIAKSI